MAATDLTVNIKCALRHVKNVCNITDEADMQWAAAINLYTQETPLYAKLNSMMRGRNRKGMDCFLPFLKLLLCGVYKLPLQRQGLAFRGVNAKDQEVTAALAATYKAKEGKEVVWWSVTSCTETIRVLENLVFSGQQGTRVRFYIQNCCSVKISQFSSMPEDEVILLPGSVFVVKSVLDAGNGLYQIQMQQDPSEFMVDYLHPDLLAEAPLSPSPFVNFTPAPAIPPVSFV